MCHSSVVQHVIFYFFFSSIRFLDELREAKDGQWINITERSIDLPDPPSDDASIMSRYKAIADDGLKLFLTMFSTSIRKHLLKSTFPRAFSRAKPPTKEYEAVLMERIMRYVAYVVRVCSKGVIGLRDDLDSGAGGVITRTTYDDIRSRLNPQFTLMIDELNTALGDLIKVNDSWAFYCHEPFVVIA